MAYEAFDPRKSIRETIGTEWDIQKDGNTAYCFTVEDNTGDTVYIPMYLSEEVKAETLEAFPFIEMEIVDTTYEPHDVGATTRKMIGLINLHVYFTDTDNIDATSFALKIKNKLHDLVRTYQATFPNIYFANVENDAYDRETDGTQVVYHYTAILYALWYDAC